MPITQHPGGHVDAYSDPYRRARFSVGGGAVLGGAVLVGGDPGVGKSTLLLQALASVARSGAKALYALGEESASTDCYACATTRHRYAVALFSGDELFDRYLRTRCVR